MHFAEKGATGNITYGVVRDKSFVWNFIAVVDNILTILSDIKQPVRAGYSILEDAKGASYSLPLTRFLAM